MFRLFKRKKKTDPELEWLIKENERLDKILEEHKKERAKLEEEIDKAEKALKALGYMDKDLKKNLNKNLKWKSFKEGED